MPNTRLYSIEEIEGIWAARGMRVVETFGDYYGAAASAAEMPLMVYSVKG